MTTRVLVVDDDPVQSRLVEAMLRRLGHEPLAVGSGEAALRLMSDSRAEPVDCMVLDLTMPGLDGVGVFARLRARGIDTPVIVQVAPGGVDAAVAAIRAGAYDFLVKPAGAERLQVSLANALAQAALKAELRRLRRIAGPEPAVIDGAPAMVPVEPSALSLLDMEGRVRPIAELEAEIIRFAVLRHGGRMSEVARRLKIGRSTLYRKLGELQLAETTQIEAVPELDQPVAPE